MENLTEKEGLTAEEKAVQIQNTIIGVEGDPLTEADEFNIIAGKGVEYTLPNGTVIYIPPLTIRQYGYLLELEKLEHEMDAPKILMGRIDVISKIIGIEADKLQDILCKDDVEEILQLTLYCGLSGRSLFKKKVITKQEVQNIILQLRRLVLK